jgi:hypothetical protein
LLPDFVADVTVIRMQFFQFGNEGVDFFIGEFIRRRRRQETLNIPRFFNQRLVTSPPTTHNASDKIQHIQRPPALFGGNFFQWFDLLELRMDLGGRNDDGSSRRKPALTFNWSGLTSVATGLLQANNPDWNRNAPTQPFKIRFHSINVWSKVRMRTGFKNVLHFKSNSVVQEGRTKSVRQRRLTMSLLTEL